MTPNFVFPLISSLLSFILSALILKRYVERKGTYLLFWGFGMIFYGIGGFCEGFYAGFGWNPLIFRLWYLSAAILVAAWLGQGSVYFLWRKKAVPHLLTVLLLLGSVYGAFKVFTASLDPSLMTVSLQSVKELSGHAITSSGVRILTPFFNIYGTIMLVGAALWSAYMYLRKRILLNRAIGSILIAFGAMAPAIGGAASRFGVPNTLYLGELMGVVLIFTGFLRSNRSAGPDDAK